MDTMPVRSDVSLHAYLNLDPEADIVASSNPRQAIIMNSGVLFVRNTAWSHSFLESWWQRRCGYKDQLSLWATLFAEWGKRVPQFAMRPELFHNYTIARTHALHTLVQIRRASWPALRDERWPCEGRCADVLTASDCLIEPLSLPNVLLLPVAPFANKYGRMLPPLQGVGSYGLFCHGACGNLSHLKESPVGCFRVIRNLHINDTKANPFAQCASCQGGSCALCGYCNEAYRSDDVPSNARFANFDACVRSWSKTKVIGIGWIKTGLSTLSEVFRQLGLLPTCAVQNMAQINPCKSTVKSRIGWKLNSVKEAMRLYPHSKFILTTRSNQSWNMSIAHWAVFSSKKTKGPIAKDVHVGSAGFLRSYVKYNEGVRSLFEREPSRLLEIDVDHAPETNMEVCRFIDPALAASLPQCAWPFPHKAANCRLHGKQLGRSGAECYIL